MKTAHSNRGRVKQYQRMAARGANTQKVSTVNGDECMGISSSGAGFGQPRFCPCEAILTGGDVFPPSPAPENGQERPQRTRGTPFKTATNREGQKPGGDRRPPKGKDTPTKEARGARRDRRPPAPAGIGGGNRRGKRQRRERRRTEPAATEREDGNRAAAANQRATPRGGTDRGSAGAGSGNGGHRARQGAYCADPRPSGRRGPDKSPPYPPMER